MRIGIFTECYKPTINGVVMSIEAFRTELEKKGHQVFIFAPNHKNAEFQPNVFRVPSFYLLSPKDYPLTLPYLSYSFLQSTIFSLKLDIIHTQHIFIMGGIGQTLARKNHIPAIHTYHTMMTEYTHYFPIKFLRGLAKNFIIIRSKRFCNRAKRVIVPSTPMVNVLKSYGVESPIEVLPTGIDLKNFRKLNQNERRTIFKKYHIPFDKKILLFVGRLAQEKNLDFLLESFKLTLSECPNTHLVFVGSGPYETNLKFKIENLKLEENTTLTGFLEKSIANKFFGAADLFVFPSTTDTQGIVLAESLASSTPVVAVNQLGPKDIVKDFQDGYLVPLNKKEFSAKIVGLLKDDRLRKKFSQTAKINVKRFSIENCTKRLIEIYKQTISKN